MKRFWKRLLFCLLVLPNAVVAIPCFLVCMFLDLIIWIVTGKDAELEMGEWADKTIFLAFKLVEEKPQN